MTTVASRSSGQHPGLETDRNGLEVLEREECLELLATKPVGRIGICLNALPVILPVNFVIGTPPGADEPLIVVRSTEGTKTTSALMRCVVALEVDEYDPLRHIGWSVLVQGVSRLIEDRDELEWAEALPLLPWAVPGAHCYLGLDLDLVRGRRFGVTHGVVDLDHLPGR